MHVNTRTWLIEENSDQREQNKCNKSAKERKGRKEGSSSGSGSGRERADTTRTEQLQLKNLIRFVVSNERADVASEQRRLYCAVVGGTGIELGKATHAHTNTHSHTHTCTHLRTGKI